MLRPFVCRIPVRCVEAVDFATHCSTGFFLMFHEVDCMSSNYAHGTLDVTGHAFLLL